VAPFILAGLIAQLVIMALLCMYSWFLYRRRRVQRAWRALEAELHKRHELVPLLVECVRVHARRNRTVLEGVTSARLAAMAIERTPDAQAHSEQTLSDRLEKMLDVAERVPEIQTNAEFRALHQTLDVIEGKIRVARDDYNEQVGQFDALVKRFPSMLVARVFGIDPMQYFDVDGSTSPLGAALAGYVNAS
jgi:LemA protein